MSDIQLNTIYNEDCLETMKHMPDNFVDWIITDPPYGIDIGNMAFTKSGDIYASKNSLARRNDYRGKGDWDNVKIPKPYFDEMFRVSKNQAIFGGNYYTDILPPTASWIVWDKRTEKKYNNDFADCELVWVSNGKPARVIRYLWSGMLQGNMKNKEKRKHPTQKPAPVMRQLIELLTDNEDEIYDPFMGSGTTARAAKDLNRNYIGSEISKEYCEIAEERLRQGVLL